MNRNMCEYYCSQSLRLEYRYTHHDEGRAGLKSLPSFSRVRENLNERCILFHFTGQRGPHLQEFGLNVLYECSLRLSRRPKYIPSLRGPPSVPTPCSHFFPLVVPLTRILMLKQQERSRTPNESPALSRSDAQGQDLGPL